MPDGLTGLGEVSLAASWLGSGPPYVQAGGHTEGGPGGLCGRRRVIAAAWELTRYRSRLQSGRPHLADGNSLSVRGRG